jgi:hypothetical protein
MGLMGLRGPRGRMKDKGAVLREGGGVTLDFQGNGALIDVG